MKDPTTGDARLDALVTAMSDCVTARRKQTDAEVDDSSDNDGECSDVNRDGGAFLE